MYNQSIMEPFTRYWQATLRDGLILQGDYYSANDDGRWRELDKSQIYSLSLGCEDWIVSLPRDQTDYQKGVGASATLSGKDFRIESFWIGCRLNGGKFLKLRLLENAKAITTEISL